MELNVIHRDSATGAPGELVVHYSEKLVILLRECRQLSELGYTIPKAIGDAVATGERFYRYGLKLKQVANFYNTMGEQMIPSQMGMLLTEAQYFERVIKENKGVTWNNPEICDRYMSDLMQAAEKVQFIANNHCSDFEFFPNIVASDNE
jgi:dynein heavy chain 2